MLYAALICLIILISVDLVMVDGCSMEPVLKEGQLLIVNKLAYSLSAPLGRPPLLHWKEVELGDIVVYREPGENRNVVKRCLGVEGDVIIHINGAVVINQATLPLNLLQTALSGNIEKVPKGAILAIGDNLDDSIDSRNYGFIPLSAVRGKVILHGNNDDR